MDQQSEVNDLSPNEHRLLMAHCVFWLSVDEMSTREKSLALLDDYVTNVDLSADSNSQSFYKAVILDSCVYFLQSHFGREHVMKYFSMLIRSHSVRCMQESESHVEDSQFLRLEFSDLAQLISSNKDKDFFDLIFNIKLTNRGLAIKELKKKIKKGLVLKPGSIRKVITRIFDYYLYEYWQETNKKTNTYSAARVDSVRRMLQGVTEVYGQLVSMLEFGPFIRFIKDKIFSLDGKSEEYAETTVKIICSCTENLKTDLPNVLERIQKEQEAMNQKAQGSTAVSRFLDAYQDSQGVADARFNYDLNLPEFKQPERMQEELDQQRIDMATAAAEIDEEEEEKIEEITLSSSQYKVLKIHIVAPLKRHLLKRAEKETNKFSVRPEVAMAVLHIIKYFPMKVFNIELIGTISKICSVLSDRDEDRRKTARNTIANLQSALGPYYFGFFVKELSFHLKRGYEMHIRNFMIYKLLSILVAPIDGRSPVATGQLDYAIPTVAPLLVDEICGDLEEEKEIQEIKNKSIEFKRNKGIECFKMLAQKLNFKSNSLKLLVDSLRDSFINGSQINKVTTTN